MPARSSADLGADDLSGAGFGRPASCTGGPSRVPGFSATRRPLGGILGPAPCACDDDHDAALNSGAGSLTWAADRWPAGPGAFRRSGQVTTHVLMDNFDRPDLPGAAMAGMRVSPGRHCSRACLPHKGAPMWMIEAADAQPCAEQATGAGSLRGMRGT